MPSRTKQKTRRNKHHRRGGGDPIEFGKERYTQLNEHPHMLNIIAVATEHKRYLMLETLSKFMTTSPPGGSYNRAADNYVTVRTYNDLQDYIHNYIQNSEKSPYGTIINPSPLNNETIYIQAELLAFNDKGYIPFDSQIGCVTYDQEGVIMLNRPYIQLMMTNGRFGALQAKLRDHPILCEVPSNDETESILHDIPMVDKGGYKTMYIGMLEPPKEAGPEIYNYIFLNKFFHDLLGLIYTIGGGATP